MGGEENNLFGNKGVLYMWYKKGMMKMYLLLKLIQVPWSIKTMLDFCLLVWLTFFLRTSLVAQTVKRLSTMRETRVWSLGREDPLEKEIVTHSSILAWEVSWTEEPLWLQSMASERDTTWQLSTRKTISCSIYLLSKYWSSTDFMPDFVVQAGALATCQLSQPQSLPSWHL